jgi:1-acyl-sn-glycerol-3-phosphate acyltransferase
MTESILKPYFAESSYDTPEDQPRRLLDRLALNTRLYFAGGYIATILKARSLAVKGAYDKQAWIKSSIEIVNLIEGCGGRFHLRGLDHLQLCRGPVVFISNHMSTLETFVFPCIIAPLMDVTFVVKRFLVKIPCFGPVMRSRNPIVVNRRNPREDFETVMAAGKDLLAQGTSVIIFPQGTRVIQFNPAEFNSLGIKLAKAAGVQVVPVAIKTDFWGYGKYLKDFGPIRRDRPIWMIFGEPFSVQGNGKEEHQRVIEFIRKNLPQEE